MRKGNGDQRNTFIAKPTRNRFGDLLVLLMLDYQIHASLYQFFDVFKCHLAAAAIVKSNDLNSFVFRRLNQAGGDFPGERGLPVLTGIANPDIAAAHRFEGRAIVTHGSPFDETTPLERV